MNKKKKLRFMLIGLVVLCVLIGIGIIFGKHIKESNLEQEMVEQLTLGNKYLEELDYEQAIMVYKAILEVDPKNEEATLGLAEAYVQMEEYEQVLEVLNKGNENIGSEALKDVIERMENLIQEEYDEDENLCEYDEQINLIKSIGYRVDGTVYEYIEYEYENGNLKKEKTYNAEGFLSNCTEYEYDEFERLKKKKDTSFGDSVIIITDTEYIYDEKGNLYQMRDTHEFAGAYSEGTYYELEYDENENLVKKIWYDVSYLLQQNQVIEVQHNALDYTEYKYNKNGKVTSGIRYFYGAVCYYIEYKYDENENLINEINSFDGVETNCTEYEYDKNGNLIKKTLRFNGIEGNYVEYEYATFKNKNTISMNNIVQVIATSSLLENDMIYSAENIIDGELSNAWAEGVDGNGIGESITVVFDGEYWVDGFIIYNGYQKTQELYEKNSKIARITIEFPNDVSLSYDLNDMKYADAQNIQFDEPIYCSKISFVIEDVYVGTSFEDTLVSELILY